MLIAGLLFFGNMVRVGPLLLPRALSCGSPITAFVVNAHDVEVARRVGEVEAAVRRLSGAVATVEGDDAARRGGRAAEYRDPADAPGARAAVFPAIVSLFRVAVSAVTIAPKALGDVLPFTVEFRSVVGPSGHDRAATGLGLVRGQRHS